MGLLKGTAIAILAFTTSATTIAYQDITSLAAKTDQARWLTHIPEAPGNTVFAAALPSGTTVNATTNVNVDPMIVGSVTAGGEATGLPMKMGADGKVRVATSTKVRSGPNPQRINRGMMGNRVVSATMKRPPSYFSAGTVVQRHSMLEPRSLDGKVELAFVKPKPVDEAIEVARAFHRPKAKGLTIKPDLPVMVANLVRESASSVLAYSPEPQPERSPFAAVLNEGAPISIIPKLDKNDHQWAAKPLPKRVFSKSEQACLARGIYFEARGEPVKGQAAVSQVILNRVRNPSYPQTICGVVYQNKHWRNRCQFSFACDRIKDNINNKRLWEMAQYVARETTAGRIWLPQVGSSTHYHATYVNPKWAHSMKRVGRIGLHIFYRTYGGGWS